VLIRVEAGTKAKLRADTGVWIEQIYTTQPPLLMGEVPPGMTPPPAAMPEPLRSPLGLRGDMPQQATEAAPVSQAAKAATNDVITVTFRAVSLTSTANMASADTDTAFAVLNELKSSSLFDPDGTGFVGTISPPEPPGTFTFGVTIKLKRPLKL
jgi:hypothetical protein